MRCSSACATAKEIPTYWLIIDVNASEICEHTPNFYGLQQLFVVCDIFLWPKGFPIIDKPLVLEGPQPNKEMIPRMRSVLPNRFFFWVASASLKAVDWFAILPWCSCGRYVRAWAGRFLLVVNLVERQSMYSDWSLLFPLALKLAVFLPEWAVLLLVLAFYLF